MNEAALLSGITAVDTSVSFVRWQQGEQTVTGWVLSFSMLWIVGRHLTSPISVMLCKWVPMMFWVVLITHSGTFLSRAEPCFQ